jgi:diguanylate cyclase (GGDEF)-like protein
MATTGRRARVRSVGIRLTGLRALVLLAFATPFLVWAVERQFPAVLLALATLFLVLAEAEQRVAPLVPWRHRDLVQVGFRCSYAVLAVAGAASAFHWHWWLPATLTFMVVHAAFAMPLRAVVLVTAVAALVNAGVPAGFVLLAGHDEVHGYHVGEMAVLSFVIMPVAATLLYRRSQSARAEAAEVRRRAERLAVASDELRQAQSELQRWNQQLTTELEHQSGALDERNRYLSIINAVSFALAEPMDDERALERAIRLVARLLGVRAAQAYTRPRDERVIDLFATVAPDDVHAPRLPETLLRSVASSGRPLSSSDPSAAEAELPDLGEPYHVIPLVAKGRVLGSFALIGTGALRNDDDGRHLLLLVGRELGIALENARLYQEAVDKASREEFLTEVTRLLNASSRGERAIPEILSALLRHTDADETLLVTLPEGSRDVVVAGTALADGAPARLEDLARSLTRIVRDRGAPVILGVGGEAPLSDRLAAAGVTTLAVAPIYGTRGNPTGDLVIRRPDDDLPAPPESVLAGALIVLVGARGEWRDEHRSLVERVTEVIARRIQADEFVAVQQQRIRELTGLAEVARTMQSGADVERLYQGFAAALQRLLGYDALYVARVDDSGRLTDIPTFSVGGRPAPAPAFAPHHGGHGWFSLRSSHVWSRGDSEPPAFLSDRTRYAVVVPMRPKGQMLGLAILSVPRPLRADQVRIVEQAVEQLSLALDSATLYQQATARASHIQALSNLARIVASVVNLREAFSAFSEEVRWLIPFDQSVMFLLDETQGIVEPYATYPDGGDRHEAVPLERSIASVPIAAGTAVTFRRNDARHADLDWSVLGPDAREVAAVPVRQGDRTSAVFALVTNHAGAYRVSELDALDEVAGLLAVTIDRLRLYEQADYSAKHDLLTGLPNYRYLQERLETLAAEYEAARDETKPAALMVVDMDNLKVFNDTLGHEVGDLVIQQVGHVLRTSCRAEDFVARTGGDEFVVLMAGADAETALNVSERIHAVLRDAHLEIAGAETRVGVSIGVAGIPGDTAAVSSLLQIADQAMYDAKFAGGQRTRLASERSGAAEPRGLRGRSIQLADLLIRTLAAGGTHEELEALSLAQRWAGSVMGRVNLPPEFLPQLRLVLASGASRRFSAPGASRDQSLARYLVDRIEEDWDDLGDGQLGEQLTFLAGALLDLAWATSPRPVGQGMNVGSALERISEAHPQAELFPVWAALRQVARKSAERRRPAA